MTPPTPSFARVQRSLLAACLLLSPMIARGQEGLGNWPLVTPPPGINPAVFPVPRNEWLAHFLTNLDRAKKGGIDLIFDGDSITDSWQGLSGKELWAKNYEPLHAADFGMSGDCTEHLLWRLSKGQVAGLHPKMVVLLIGTNNTGKYTDAQIAEGITAIVQEYQRLCPEAVILLQGVFPRGEKPTDPVRAKIKSINATVSKLGDGKKVIYLDFGDKFLSPDGTISREIMPDFLHPNGKGYAIWVEAIRPEIERVFGKPAGAN